MIGRIRQSVLLVCAGLVLASCTRPLPVSVIDGGRDGQVKVIKPANPDALVIFFSDRYGADAASDTAAQALARSGALVVEVNTPAYLKRLDGGKEKCNDLVGDVEGLSRQLQRQLKFRNYVTPVLAGIGEGGTIAELALAQAPAVTIAGAVAVDPSPSVAGKTPICSDSTVHRTANGFSYGASKSLPGYWTVDLTPGASAATRDYIRAMQRAGAPIQVHEVSLTAPPGEQLASMVDSHRDRPRFEGDIAALPLIELPVDHPSRLMAVVLSGDGGWRDLDKTIAEDLRQDGVPVVGWDTLRYFWNERTPQQTTDDLVAVMNTYMARWRADEVALVGYSFGADVLPFAYDRLPPDVRSHVRLLALLGFAKSADFEIRVGGWLGLPASPDAQPVLPATAQIPPSLIQCFYGEHEEDTVCPNLAVQGVEVIKTPGGHHFGGDYGMLEKDILAGFRRRADTSVVSAEHRPLPAGKSGAQQPTRTQ